MKSYDSDLGVDRDPHWKVRGTPFVGQVQPIWPEGIYWENGDEKINPQTSPKVGDKNTFKGREGKEKS